MADLSLSKTIIFRFLIIIRFKKYSVWAIGLAALIGAFMIFLLASPLWAQKNRNLIDEVTRIESSLITFPHQANQSDVFELSHALESFDRLASVTDDLQAIASQNNITVTEATFKPTEGKKDAGIGAIEISAHAKGNYVSVKKTLAALLESHAGLALESLAFLRLKSSDVVLDVDLRFKFFYRKAT